MKNGIALNSMPIEIININPVNEMISSCDVKVLYPGKNRNYSYITRAVAGVIANSLPRIPIVGFYLEEIKDFTDHGEEIVINSQGVSFKKKTVPYGFVSEDRPIWWQWFKDPDGVDREYLMCSGYLWTGRYPECERVIKEGNGQSMEFDPNSLKGEWAILENEGNEYFIVDEAIFSALCILGENVEPCFEGASIGGKGTLYSLDKNEFKAEMTKFMLEVKEVIKKGGETMKLGENGEVIEDSAIETPAVDNSLQNEDPIVEPENNETVPAAEDFTANETEDTDVPAEDFVAEDSETVDEEPEVPVDNSLNTDTSEIEDENVQTSTYNLDEVIEYQTLKADYDKLLADFEALKEKLNTIEPEYTRLQSEEKATEKLNKEEMINKFSLLLGEEDIKPIKETMDTYSLEEIEAKLSVIAVRKGVNFNLDNSDNSKDSKNDPIISFSTKLNTSAKPGWIKALDARKKK